MNAIKDAIIFVGREIAKAITEVYHIAKDAVVSALKGSPLPFPLPSLLSLPFLNKISSNR
jgi:hypothetical protein